MGIRSFVCALTVLGLTALTPTPAEAQVSVTFYDTLSPHGDWVVVENYGRVWRPHRTIVGVDFVPYASGGRWVHSNVGWIFEPSPAWSWGWIPFHYGRWYQDPFNGWVWVPDNVWAPAWVEWRTGGGYIGWAPSPPRYHSHVRHHWYFVENRRFVEPNIWEHRARPVNVDVVYQSTRPISPPSGQAWAPGPQVHEVRAFAPIPIPERKIDGPPPRPIAMFPKDMAPAAPPPPPGTQRGAMPAPSEKLQPVERMVPPPGQREGPPSNKGDPLRAPPPVQREAFQQPQPMQRDPMRAPPPQQPTQQPMQRDMRVPPPVQQQPMQREPMRAPQPMQREPIQREPMRGPPPTQQQPMQREMRVPQQQPQPIQRAPQPMQQPMQRAPMQQPTPQPMQRAPMQQPVPAPQQQPQQQPQGNPRKAAQPMQPFQQAPNSGPQRGTPPGPPR
jgi:hypothetical protein